MIRNEHGSQFKLKTLGLLPLAMAPLLVSAESSSPMLTEAAWVADIPSVVFATRQEQSVTSAPSSVTIITREMIEAQGANNVADIMQLVPGFQTFHSNGMTYGVTAHGLSDRFPKRLEVRVNGRSVYMPQLSSVAWESLGLTPADIDHIEVVRGSNVPSYGSNAILGAINIVTHNPLRSGGGSVSATYGSAGTEQVSVRQHLSLESTDLMVRAARRESNGFSGVNDSGDVSHVVVSGIFTPTLATTLEAEIGYSSGKVGIGDGDHPQEFRDDERDAAWFNGSWQLEQGRQMWKARFSFTDYTFERSFTQTLAQLLEIPAEWIPFVIPGRENETFEIGEGRRDFFVANAELEHHIEFDHGRLVWGLGARKDRLSNDVYLGSGAVDSDVFYGFSNVHWRLSPQLELNAGFMLEDKGGYDLDVSPRLALNYHVSDQHHIRASVTQAYRQPALLESDMEWAVRFADGEVLDLVEVSADDVSSERVTTYELGYMGFWRDGNVSTELKLFREEMDGGIESFDVEESNCTDPEPGQQQALAQQFCPSFYTSDGQYGAPLDKRVRSFNNVADWHVNGFEASLNWTFGERHWMRFNYSWLMADGRWARRIHREPYIFSMSEFVPRSTAGLLYSVRVGSGWDLSGFYQYLNSFTWRSGTVIDSYTRLDLRLAKSWKTRGGDLTTAVVAQNALDEEYLEYQRKNDFHRRIFLSLTYHWD